MINKVKKFKLFNEKWAIHFVDKIEDKDLSEEGKYILMGVTYSDEKKIVIATKFPNGNDVPEDTIKLTVLHEIFHAICTTGAYLEYNTNEPFIEWCAKCTDDLLRQKVI